MFEKEAEKWVENNLHNTEEDYIKAFQDGAEFGYNFAKEEIDYLNKHWRSEEERKANEWHYVKDGDLPKDNRKVFLYAKDKECYMGFFENGAWKYESGFYATDDFVIAWKEIVLPKELAG